MIDCLLLTRYFLFKESMGNLKLQKLCYYAQAWYVTIFNEPLIKNHFEAWVNGPVCPDIYHKYKTYGSSAIKLNENEHVDVKRDVEIFLDKIYELYGPFNAKVLVKMTHNEDPWKKAREGLSPFDYSSNVISIESMKRYYSTHPNYTMLKPGLKKELGVYAVTVCDGDLDLIAIKGAKKKDIIANYIKGNFSSKNEFFDELYTEKVKYTFFFYENNIFTVDELSEGYIMNPKEHILESMKTILGSNAPTIDWTVPDIKSKNYSYTFLEAGIMACAETYEKTVEYAIASIIDSNEFFINNTTKIAEKSKKIRILEKVNELYVVDRDAFMDEIKLKKNYLPAEV